MKIQYICELYFDNEKSSQQELMKLAVQSLGFIPNIMSIYVNMDEMFEEAKNDPTIIIVKSSVPDLANVETPVYKGETKVPKDMTILELLDRVLTKGVILTGDLVISVADIDLIYLGVKLMLSSVETMEQLKMGKKIGDL